MTYASLPRIRSIAILDGPSVVLLDGIAAMPFGAGSPLTRSRSDKTPRHDGASRPFGERDGTLESTAERGLSGIAATAAVACGRGGGRIRAGRARRLPISRGVGDGSAARSSNPKAATLPSCRITSGPPRGASAPAGPQKATALGGPPGPRAHRRPHPGPAHAGDEGQRHDRRPRSPPASAADTDVEWS